MNERFTLDSTLIDIVENERVNRKLAFFFDMQLCEQVKWPFNKMKLKHMMKLVHFPGQELVSAANFILERREAGEKISIPIWRDLPEGEAETAQDVILIPFVKGTEAVPAVLICPDMDDYHLKIMPDSMKMADRISQAGCQAFILNYRPECGGQDMVRAIRFLRANCRKLRIVPEKIALLAFRGAGTPALEMYLHVDPVEDVTHRYDDIKGDPNQLWIIEMSEKTSGDGAEQKPSGDGSDGIYVSQENREDISDSPWLDERLNGLKLSQV